MGRKNETGIPNDGASEDYFGYAVSLDNGYAIVESVRW